MENLETWVKWIFIALVVLAVPMLILRKQEKQQQFEELRRRQKAGASNPDAKDLE